MSLSEEDLCDVSWSFVYMPHEDDEPTEFFTSQPQRDIFPDFQTITLEDGVVLKINRDTLKDIVKSASHSVPTLPDPLHQHPSCSKTPDFQVSVPLTTGIKMELSSEKYHKFFNIPQDQQEKDDDQKSVTIDTDSDHSDKEDSADESDEKTKASEKEKKSKKTNDKDEKSNEKNSKKKDKESEKKKGDKQTKESKSVDEKKNKKASKKRKSRKDSDASATPSSESLKKVEPKKKKKRGEKSPKPEKKEESEEEDSSDDEEIKKINQAASKIPTYKSIKNLIKQKYYKVLDLNEVETSKGKTIRLRLDDTEVEDGWCYVHMPRNVLVDMFPLIEKLRSMCQSDKGLFFKFAGMKGLAFKIKFARGPK